MGSEGGEFPMSEPIQHDWPEDFSHENGNYQNRCFDCGTIFMGHKRRVQCKRCAGGAMGSDVEQAAREWLRQECSGLPAFTVRSLAKFLRSREQAAYREGEQVGFREGLKKGLGS